MIRIWDFETGRCLTIITTEVSSLKCLSFSPDGNLLTSTGKDYTNRELIVVWNISGILKDEKPSILAK
jgi:WD40 repeat protein